MWNPSRTSSQTLRWRGSSIETNNFVKIVYCDTTVVHKKIEEGDRHHTVNRVHSNVIVIDYSPGLPSFIESARRDMHSNREINTISVIKNLSCSDWTSFSSNVHLELFQDNIAPSDSF